MSDWKKANTEEGGFKKELDAAKIHFHVNEEDITNVLMMVEGPQYKLDPITSTNKETPYFGGFYFFKMDFPDDYPYAPLKIKFKTTSPNWRCHPNFYSSELVCLSSINTWGANEWTPMRNISSEALIIQERFDNIPLRHEPGQESATESNFGGEYNKCVEYGNYRYGIIKMLKNTPEEFLVFKDKMIEIFLEKYTLIEEKVFRASKLFHGKKIKSPMYGMHFECNYIEILNNLRELYCKYKNVEFDLNFWSEYYAINDKPYGEYPRVSNKKQKIEEEKPDDKANIDISIELDKNIDKHIDKNINSKSLETINNDSVSNKNTNGKIKRNPPSVSAGNYNVGDELISDRDGRVYYIGLTKSNKHWWYLKK